MRLPCENIHDFINGIKHHYSVTTDDHYEQGKAITLYNDYNECDFRIENIIRFNEHVVLSLKKIEGSEYERDVHSTYYGMTNPLD